MKKNILETLTKNRSVGIPQIDAQHRRLNNLIGGLSEMCRNRVKVPEIPGEVYRTHNSQNRSSPQDIDFAIMVKQTLYYVNYHIKFKEKLMEETLYPALEEHKKFHDVFFANFLKHIRAFESREQFNPENLSVFLYDWFDSHFFMDMDMGLHIKKSRKNIRPNDRI